MSRRRRAGNVNHRFLQDILAKGPVLLQDVVRDAEVADTVAERRRIRHLNRDAEVKGSKYLKHLKDTGQYW